MEEILFLYEDAKWQSTPHPHFLFRIFLDAGNKGAAFFLDGREVAFGEGFFIRIGDADAEADCACGEIIRHIFKTDAADG